MSERHRDGVSGPSELVPDAADGVSDRCDALSAEADDLPDRRNAVRSVANVVSAAADPMSIHDVRHVWQHLLSINADAVPARSGRLSANDPSRRRDVLSGVADAVHERADGLSDRIYELSAEHDALSVAGDGVSG